jgi:two-component system, OmpR family, copper resistance phosphate regulon response regulator CusR
MTMRILVVEDERRIAAFIEKGLREENYAVDVAYDGIEALDWASAVDYDLILLDVLLPHKDGIEVCQELRAQGSRVPILMITARDAIEDRVRGLDSGADDYLVKPFAFPELAARIRALLRRGGEIKTPHLQVGELVLDTLTRRATRSGQVIELSTREYALLEFLMRHPGQVLSRTQIVDHVWSYDFAATSNVVDVYIGYLRRKVDDGFEAKLIRTMRGSGYTIEAER